MELKLNPWIGLVRQNVNNKTQTKSTNGKGRRKTLIQKLKDLKKKYQRECEISIYNLKLNTGRRLPRASNSKETKKLVQKDNEIHGRTSIHHRPIQVIHITSKPVFNFKLSTEQEKKILKAEMQTKYTTTTKETQKAISEVAEKKKGFT